MTNLFFVFSERFWNMLQYICDSFLALPCFIMVVTISSGERHLKYVRIFFHPLILHGLVQDCDISIANTLEISQSCTKTSICLVQPVILRIYSAPLNAGRSWQLCCLGSLSGTRMLVGVGSNRQTMRQNNWIQWKWFIIRHRQLIYWVVKDTVKSLI